MPGRPEPQLQRNAPLALQPSSAIIVPEHRLWPESAHVPTSRRGRPAGSRQAEDAAQESLIRIWRALDRYDGRASLSSWIYAITRNRCLTALERRRTVDSLDELGEENELGSSTAEPACDGRAEQLRGLVALLPERLRRVLVLYYYEERSVREVALMLGCPEGTVKATLFRARAALTEMLKRRRLDDPACWQEETP